MGEYIPSLILACGFLALIIAFWFFNKSRFTFSISSLVLSGLFFRIYSALDPFLHAWDERYHALVAKNLLKHPLVPTLYDLPLLDQDLLWVGSHIWLHKQPLALWLISGSISIFGNTDFAIRYSLERMKIGFERLEPKWKTEILDIAKNNEGKKLVLFNCQHYVEAMDYTELIAYDKTPNEADLKKIKETG